MAKCSGILFNRDTAISNETEITRFAPEVRPGGDPPKAGPRAVPGDVLRHFPGSREASAAYPYRFIRKLKSRNVLNSGTKSNAVAILNESGVVLALQKIKGPEGSKGVRGDRKPVTEFTRRSRGKLMAHLRRVRWSELVQPIPKARQGRAFFITLTYDKAPNIAESKQDLKLFMDSARKRWPGLAGFWKLESQEERAQNEGVGFIAHYHLLFDCRKIQLWRSLRDWVAAHWSRGRIDVWTAYGSGSQLMSYLGKYLGKDTAGAGTGVGRYWGKFGKVPMSERRRLFVDMATALHTLAELLPENKFVAERAVNGCKLLKLDGNGLADAFEREMILFDDSAKKSVDN